MGRHTHTHTHTHTHAVRHSNISNYSCSLWQWTVRLNTTAVRPQVLKPLISSSSQQGSPPVDPVHSQLYSIHTPSRLQDRIPDVSVLNPGATKATIRVGCLRHSRKVLAQHLSHNRFLPDRFQLITRQPFQHLRYSDRTDVLTASWSEPVRSTLILCDKRALDLFA